MWRRALGAAGTAGLSATRATARTDGQNASELGLLTNKASSGHHRLATWQNKIPGARSRRLQLEAQMLVIQDCDAMWYYNAVK